MNAKHKQLENSRAIVIKYKLKVNFPYMVFLVSYKYAYTGVAEIKDIIKDVKQTNSKWQVVDPPTHPLKNLTEHGSVYNIHTL